MNLQLAYSGLNSFEPFKCCLSLPHGCTREPKPGMISDVAQDRHVPLCEGS